VVSVSLDELADQLGPELGVGAGRVDLDVGAAGAFDLAQVWPLNYRTVSPRLSASSMALRISLCSGGMLEMCNRSL
jgi:hypothetical protein